MSDQANTEGLGRPQDSATIIRLEDALMHEKLRRRVAEHDARHMRMVLELIAEQPTGRKSRHAAHLAVQKTKNAAWLRSDDDRRE